MKWFVGWLVGVLLFVPAGELYARQIFPLKGVWDYDRQTVSVDIGHGQQWPFSLEGNKRSDTEYDLHVVIQNWDTAFLNLSTVLKGSIIVLPSETAGKSVLSGRLASMYTLVNQHPFEEWEINFSLRDGVLDVRSFRLGGISASGQITFGPQASIDLIIRLDQILLTEFMCFVQKDGLFDMGGSVSGEIRIQGPMDRVQIRGNVNSYNGFMGEYAYNSAQLYFAGIFPSVYVDNSHVTQADGLSFEVQGVLDLRDLKNLKKQFRGFVGTPLISQSEESIEWTFKRLRSHQKGGATELKYMIKKDESSGKDVNILGVQRRVEF